MYRTLILSALALALFAPRVQALEMFTNFHNGENIGFPPMEVPTAIYGRGGWNRNAIKGCPARVPSIESVPAMTPTGYARANHVWKSYEAQNVGDQVQYVSDRRHGWGGNNYAPNSGSNQATGYSQPAGDYESPSTSAPQSPTPAKLAPKSDGWTKSLETAPTDDESAKHPISVFARPGAAPQTESKGKVQSIGDQRDDRGVHSLPGSSSRRTSENLRAGESDHSDAQQ